MNHHHVPLAAEGQLTEEQVDPWVRKIPWKREWLPTPIFLPGEYHGQRSLAGYSPRDCMESDTAVSNIHFKEEGMQVTSMKKEQKNEHLRSVCYRPRLCLGINTLFLIILETL